MKRFLYGILFMIGLKRIALGVVKILETPQAKNFVEDVIHTGVDKLMNGDEVAQQRLHRRTRDRNRPYDHQAEGL